MNCLECEFMGCKVFTCKTEAWTGYCMNPQSPRFHTNVTGDIGCNIAIEQDLFNND